MRASLVAVEMILDADQRQHLRAFAGQHTGRFGKPGMPRGPWQVPDGGRRQEGLVRHPGRRRPAAKHAAHGPGQHGPQARLAELGDVGHRLEHALVRALPPDPVDHWPQRSQEAEHIVAPAPAEIGIGADLLRKMPFRAIDRLGEAACVGACEVARSTVPHIDGTDVRLERGEREPEMLGDSARIGCLVGVAGGGTNGERGPARRRGRQYGGDDRRIEAAGYLGQGMAERATPGADRQGHRVTDSLHCGLKILDLAGARGEGPGRPGTVGYEAGRQHTRCDARLNLVDVAQGRARRPEVAEHQCLPHDGPVDIGYDEAEVDQQPGLGGEQVHIVDRDMIARHHARRIAQNLGGPGSGAQGKVAAPDLFDETCRRFVQRRRVCRHDRRAIGLVEKPAKHEARAVGQRDMGNARRRQHRQRRTIEQEHEPAVALHLLEGPGYDGGKRSTGAPQQREIRQTAHEA